MAPWRKRNGRQPEAVVMCANEGGWDRAARMLGGAALLYAGWGGGVSGPIGSVLMVAGGVALATGFVGWCPAYTMIGTSTRKATAGRCSNCETGRRP